MVTSDLSTSATTIQRLLKRTGPLDQEPIETKFPPAMLFSIPSLSGLSARHEESCKKHTNTSLNKDDLLTSFINHNMCCQRVLLSWQSQKSHRHQMKSIYTSKSYYTTGDMMSTHLSYHFGYKTTPRPR